MYDQGCPKCKEGFWSPAERNRHDPEVCWKQQPFRRHLIKGIVDGWRNYAWLARALVDRN